jgi:23S rRNA (uracil1939-C5)-methyltransferase
MLTPTQELSLTIEKPAVGGRMIARHDGQVVFVSGAIPGERVRARIEQIRGGVAYAQTLDVENASPDRRTDAGDPACAGNVLSHVSYARQQCLKAEIVADAFARIARLPPASPVPVRPSPEHGYRMRARLHAREGRIGFFREGTHSLCDAARSGQLLPETLRVLKAVEARLADGAAEVREIELSENVAATERALLFELVPRTRLADAHRLPRLLEMDGLTGLVIVRPEAPQFVSSRGHPHVSDVLELEVDGRTAHVPLRRHVTAFFQGNRFLLRPLVERVLQLVPCGSLLDLYAGAGLFGVSHAALGRGSAVAVEGDRQAAEDLRANAAPFRTAVRVVADSVEGFLTRAPQAGAATILLDPPRTGMSKEAAQIIVAAGASRVVYVSCDVATLARDVRRFVDAGYHLATLEAFDLFPNTAHVECVAALNRSA